MHNRLIQIFFESFVFHSQKHGPHFSVKSLNDSFFFSDQDALLEYESHRRRIFLRRLSGSELGSTSFLLGNGSSSEGQKSRLVLRPLSVQERIRELNLRARHFAETVMAVQLYDTVPPGKKGHCDRRIINGIRFYKFTKNNLFKLFLKKKKKKKKKKSKFV